MFTQTHFHLFQIDISEIPNTCILFQSTLCPIYQFRAKTGNNVSEFMYSIWMTKSYYSSPKYRICFNRFTI